MLVCLIRGFQLSVLGLKEPQDLLVLAVGVWGSIVQGVPPEPQDSGIVIEIGHPV